MSEGVWRTPDDFSSSVSNMSEVDFSRSSDLDILTSPSLMPDLAGTLSVATTLSASLGTNTTLGANPSLTSASSVGNHLIYICFGLVMDIHLFCRTCTIIIHRMDGVGIFSSGIK